MTGRSPEYPTFDASGLPVNYGPHTDEPEPLRALISRVYGPEYVELAEDIEDLAAHLRERGSLQPDR